MTLKDYNEYFIKSLHSVNESEVKQFIDLILKSYENNNTIFVIGNGGSAANASHFAQDLAKGTRPGIAHPKRIKALSLTDNTPFITALSNDDGYEVVFEEQLKTFSKKDDLVIAISGSGNSPNIIRAITWAKDNGLTTIGVTGFNGGKLKQINHYNLHVPLDDMCTSESVHSVIFHYIILEITVKIKQSEGL